MPLRCLLFSSNEEMVQPIWPVLADLGIEGEYCRNAVDAVERVTTQLFQIVITDWEDQPEAAFLLKTARDLKAAHRPLILAIVGDDARLPEALQAGANSVLVKPIRAEQVRDTMSTACELLRSKLQPSRKPAVPAALPEKAETAAMAAAAGAISAPASVLASVPPSVDQTPKKTFRAGEFLTSAGSAPGAEFDTEKECDVQKSLDQAAMAEVDALTDLAPTAAAVEQAVQPPEAQTALTGWASLQARLTKPMLQPAEVARPKSDLLAYGETPSYGAAPAEPPATDTHRDAAPNEPESESEAALFAYMAGEPREHAEPVERPASRRSKVLLMSVFAVGCVVLVAVPQTRQILQIFYRNAMHAGGNWLNPPPAPLPQAAAQHDSFGQEGDEYKLPAQGSIPDATTDASQIRVLPVVDPTVKAEKGAEANGGQAQAATGASNDADQKQTDQNHAGQNQAGTGQSAQAGNDQAKDQIREPSATSVGAVPESAAAASPRAALPAAQVPPAPQPRLVTSSVPSMAPPHGVSTGNSTGIPSSLKSQMASATPDASGTKPPEAAMSAIEPVNLPESAARELLAQTADPVYPAAARTSGQPGSVVLQVLIGRDGTVQDAKFLQGSLVFARTAIDAVKLWRFKPYLMNGRAVSVQSVITLNFKPPA
jgi:TonB family protein